MNDGWLVAYGKAVAMSKKKVSALKAKGKKGKECDGYISIRAAYECDANPLPRARKTVACVPSLLQPP